MTSAMFAAGGGPGFSVCMTQAKVETAQSLPSRDVHCCRVLPRGLKASGAAVAGLVAARNRLPGIVAMRHSLLAVLLVGTVLFLARRVEPALHPYPPLAAWGTLPSFSLDPLVPLVRTLMMRCRVLVAAMLVIAGLAAPALGNAAPAPGTNPAWTQPMSAQAGIGVRFWHAYWIARPETTDQRARPATLRT